MILKILLISSGLFSKKKQIELAKVKGLVSDIKWCGNYIIWADNSVSFYSFIRTHFVLDKSERRCWKESEGERVLIKFC